GPALQQEAQHRGEIEGRAADRRQDLGRGGVVLERLGPLLVAPREQRLQLSHPRAGTRARGGRDGSAGLGGRQGGPPDRVRLALPAASLIGGRPRSAYHFAALQQLPRGLTGEAETLTRLHP